MKIWVLTLKLWVLPLSVKFGVCENPVVKTEKGFIEGYVTRSFHYLNMKKSVRLQQFLGIPYAKPPINELRFQAPVENDYRNYTKAKRYGPLCPQPEYLLNSAYSSPEESIAKVVQEDCLTINVFVPITPRAKKSVMVYIHGGGFMVGGSSLPFYDGQKAAILLDKIVVTFNYRLGAFGFAYLEPYIKGNMGLKDQILALKWVKRNIGAFGGDSDDITLAGQSAGAISATIHAFSQETIGLFHKIMAQSGSLFNPFATSSAQQLNTLTTTVARNLNCTNRNSYECLKNAKVSEILKATPRYNPNLAFTPLRDNQIVNLAGHIHKDIPVLTGIVSKEASVFLIPQITANPNLVPESKPIIPKSISLKFLSQNLFIQPKLAEIFQSFNNDSDTYDELESILTQIGISCGVNHFNELVRKNGNPIYSYYFNHIARMDNSLPKYMQPSHGSDVYFTTGIMFSQMFRLIYEPRDIKLASTMLRHIKNFIQTGNPSLLNRSWPRYDQNYKAITFDSNIYGHVTPGKTRLRCPSLAILLDQNQKFNACLSSK